MASDTTVPLDETAAALIANADAQVRAIDQQIAGVMAYVMARNGLTPGEWRIADNRRELVRIVPASPIAAPNGHAAEAGLPV
jgi:hypothetical protein